MLRPAVLRRALAVGVAVPGLVVAVAASPAHAAAVAVQWSMDVQGSSVVDPGSGLRLDLSGTWRAAPGAVAFGYAGPPSLGRSSGDAVLNPGTGDFAVAATFTTARVANKNGYTANVVQKGLASARGQWKIELNGTAAGTLAQCRFEGTSGKDIVVDGARVLLDNGGRHTVSCWRSGSTLGITVDGRTSSHQKSVGAINPSSSVTVANKSASGSVKDQFNGTISCIVVARGTSASQDALARASC